MIYDRAHTRDMDELQGMRRALSWTVVAFIIGGLVSMGMPGLVRFHCRIPHIPRCVARG
jgi:NADH-quinone oxidoreductase subunit M